MMAFPFYYRLHAPPYTSPVTYASRVSVTVERWVTSARLVLTLTGTICIACICAGPPPAPGDAGAAPPPPLPAPPAKQFNWGFSRA